MSVEEFIKQEENKVGRINRMFGNYPTFRNTNEFAYLIRHKNYNSETIIRPSVTQIIIISLFIAFGIWVWSLILKIVLFADVPQLITAPFLIFVTFIICFAAWHSYFNLNYVYKIIVNAKGIVAKQKKYDWRNIEHTYVMYKHEGKSINHYLVIFLRNRLPVCLNLWKFSIGPQKISTIIEYYKSQSS